MNRRNFLQSLLGILPVWLLAKLGGNLSSGTVSQTPFIGMDVCSSGGGYTRFGHWVAESVQVAHWEPIKYRFLAEENVYLTNWPLLRSGDTLDVVCSFDSESPATAGDWQI